MLQRQAVQRRQLLSALTHPAEQFPSTRSLLSRRGSVPCPAACLCERGQHAALGNEAWLVLPAAKGTRTDGIAASRFREVVTATNEREEIVIEVNL